jgi:predicted molibdopterin-dependent oxidoreductase YjgC
VIVLGTVVPAWASAAEVVLPIANAAEDEGTFTNVRGRVQRFLQAKAAPGLARPSWFVLSDLLAELGERSNYFLASEVFAALAAAHPEFAGLSYDALGLRGATVASARQAEPAAGVA